MRIRTIKPEFWQHELMSALPAESRLLAIGLLNWADDEGYFLATPALIRGNLMPYDDDASRIPAMLQELVPAGWIQLGKTLDGRAVGRVVNFSKHQRVDRRTPSVLKPQCIFVEDSTSAREHLAEDSTQEGKGRDHGMEQGREGTPGECEQLVEKILSSYPRRDSPNEARSSIEDAVAGGKDPQSILNQVQECAAYITSAPGGASNRFVPSAKSFFQGRQWRSPEVFRDRWKDASKSTTNNHILPPTEGGVF